MNKTPFSALTRTKCRSLRPIWIKLRRDQDSVGAKITVVAEGVIPGLGEPIFDRLDAELAHALMSINAVKGIEIAPVLPVLPSAAPSIATR
ncbi:chorismate synthase [Pseudomonas fragi]|uniref:chorismate synthase n=1 Tax=Pseudomonas fragi TaxID=296 RepID=A0A449IR56_PSEFR|nr:chorismate synthase [Pseudomonas fragi]